MLRLKRLSARETRFDPTLLPNEASIQEIYGALAVDEQRLQLVVADARELLDEGRAVTVLTERRDRLERLDESLLDGVPTVVVIHSRIGSKPGRAALKKRLAEPFR